MLILLLLFLVIAVLAIIVALFGGLIAGGGIIAGIVLVIFLIVLIVKAASGGGRSGDDNVQDNPLPDAALEGNEKSIYKFVYDDVLEEDESSSFVPRYEPAADRTVPKTVANSLERAYIALNGSQFEEAKKFFDRVLDEDPHFAPAYLGKLLCSLEIRNEKNLAYAMKDFSYDTNWNSACRFATAEELKRYEGYLHQSQAERKKYEDELAENERIRKEKEAAEKARHKKKVLIGVAAFALVIVLGIGGYFLAVKIIIPEIHYNNGISLQKSGKWDEAVKEFVTAGEYGEKGVYKDSSDQIAEAHYLRGISERNAQHWEYAVLAFTRAGDYKDAKSQIQETYYQEGLAKLEAQDWYGAINAFAIAGSYKDANEQVSKAYYGKGEYYFNAARWDTTSNNNTVADWETAFNAFTSAGTYSDAVARRVESKYNWAKALNNIGEYEKAYDLFSTISEYADVNEILNTDKHMIAVAPRRELISSYVVGETTKFGKYEQDDNEQNGQEDIEWYVLEKNEKGCLLLSVLGLDVQPYNADDPVSNWQNSSLRNWLNSTFMDTAFSEEEKGSIMFVENHQVRNDINGKPIVEEPVSEDRVFLLSLRETELLKDVAGGRKCKPSKYALSLQARTGGLLNGGTDVGVWWTRDPAIFWDRELKDQAVVIDVSGGMENKEKNIEKYMVRPALWLDFDSDYFWNAR